MREQKRRIRKDCRKLLRGVICASFLHRLTNIAAPTLAAWLIGDMASALLALDKAAILTRLPAFVCAVLVQVAGTAGTELALNLLLTKQGFAYDSFLMDKFIHLPLLQIQRVEAGAVMERLEEDAAAFCWNQMTLCAYPAVAAVFGAGVIAALFRSGCPVIFALTIFVLAALPLARTACMAGIRTRLKKEASEYSEDRKQLEQELFGARDFAKSYSLHGFFVSRLEKRFRAFLQKTGKAQCRVDALVEALDFLSGQGSRLCVVLVGAFLAARGKMELGILLTGFLMLPSLTQCFAYVRGWITEKHDEAKYLDRISVFYGEFEDGEGIAPALTSLDAENVRFSYSEDGKNVRFSYSEDGKNVLSGIDFHMTGSENMRLAGQNGSGKTTLLSILAGLYEPSSGIVCGGASVGQRRKSTALQEQNGAIFSGTVWENLFLGEDKRPAAEALLEEMGFGKTLEYTVEPGGGNLSPGERKKILLTRAFLRDAPFLLLDEPMNHLDAQAAEVVKEKLRQRQGGILLISHREDICEGLGMGELLMKRKS